MTPGDCFLRVIPVKDRQSFAAFAVRLMEGPHIERSMRETLVLVLWLRFDDVEEAYPSHDLTNRIKSSATEMEVTESKLRTWILSYKDFFKEANSLSLTLNQVSMVLFVLQCQYWMCDILCTTGIEINSTGIRM